MGEGENIEGKGFVIKDKRQFTAEGEVKPNAKHQDRVANAGDAGEAQEKESTKTERMPLPEINFSSFVFSLSSSVLLHFGEIADPISGKKERNLPMAKQTIDILSILKEKTKGNLTKDEEQLLDNLLAELRIKYVQESKKG